MSLLVRDTSTIPNSLDYAWLQSFNSVYYNSFRLGKTSGNIQKIVISRIVVVIESVRHVRGLNGWQSGKAQDCVTLLSKAPGGVVMIIGKIENSSKSRSTRCEVIISWDLWVVRDMDC